MSSETKQILTTDGIPLEVSLKKAEKKNKIKAFLLVAEIREKKNFDNVCKRKYLFGDLPSGR